jgi:hypothetical protein
MVSSVGVLKVNPTLLVVLAGDLHAHLSQFGAICNIIVGHNRLSDDKLHHAIVEFEKVSF